MVTFYYNGSVTSLQVGKNIQAIVKGIAKTCQELGISVIAEGIETKDEALVLRDMETDLIQGFYFAKAGFESLPQIADDLFNLG